MISKKNNTSIKFKKSSPFFCFFFQYLHNTLINYNSNTHQKTKPYVDKKRMHPYQLVYEVEKTNINTLKKYILKLHIN